MCCAIARANPGSCAGEPRARSTSLCALPDSQRSTWKSTSGGCSPSQLPGVRLKFGKALAVSIGLSVLFLIVYGGCNWITARRPNVPTFYFEWEHWISFVPFFILPYISIALFFVAALFLCRIDRELKILSKRMVTA